MFAPNNKEIIPVEIREKAEKFTLIDVTNTNAIFMTSINELFGDVTSCERSFTLGRRVNNKKTLAATIPAKSRYRVFLKISLHVVYIACASFMELLLLFQRQFYE